MSACAVHYETSGVPDAPVLVLAGSLGSTLAMWEPQLARFGERFRVIAYDHRGHGRSPVPPGPYTVADLGCDVVALLDRLGVARASFCGLSLGGMVGMWLAAHVPERVERLVLCCTSSAMAPEAWRERAATVRAHGVEAIADAVVGRWFTPAFAARERDTVASMRAMVAATPAEGYAACCAAIEHLQLGGELERVRAPTLVVAGRDDSATPPDHGRRIAEAVTGARFEEVPRAAHLASWEQAARVNALVLDHLTPSPEEPR